MEVTAETLSPAIEQLLRTEDWDSVTVKLIMRKLEAVLPGGADLPAGWITPHKKLVKQLVDEIMAAIIAEREGEQAGAAAGGGGTEPTAQVDPVAAAYTEPEADAAAAPEADAEPAPEPEAAHAAATKGEGAEGDAERAKGAEGVAPAPASRKRPADDGADDKPAEPADAAAEPAAEEEEGEGEGEGEAAEERDEGEAAADDADDVARFVGKPIATRNGKVYYGAWACEGVTYKLGMDVYLEPSSDAEALPYVARLLEIYAYAFASDEVYFNARWYYRDSDVRQYGLKDKAKASSLRAAEGELYFSLHEDENHADTVLRGAKVCVLQGAGPVPRVEQHEYFVRSAYDSESLFDITDVDLIPKKKLRAAVAQELGRQPDMAALRERAHEAKRQRLAEAQQLAAADAEAKKRKASFDELCAIALTRRTIEVWLDAPSTRELEQVLLYSIVRLGQRLNSGAVHFAMCIVLEVRNTQPYKVGKKVSTIALWVRTGQGRKLVRLDALSNEPFQRKEYDDFSVPVTSYAAREKAERLRNLTQKNAELFSEEQRRQMEEEDAKLQARLERERTEAVRKEEDARRRERERDEVRERQAQKKVESADQWWKTHATTGDASARERAKWAARLKRFEAIAASSTEEGERTNAARLAENARKKLEEIS